MAKIAKLEGKAKKDKALARGPGKNEKEAQRIANAKMDVADYLLALYLLDDLKGQLYGYDYYVDPAWRSDWIVVDTYVDYYTPIYADVWTDYTYDWDHVTTPVDIYVDDNVYVDEPLSAAEVDASQEKSCRRSIVRHDWSPKKTKWPRTTITTSLADSDNGGGGGSTGRRLRIGTPATWTTAEPMIAAAI